MTPKINNNEPNGEKVEISVKMSNNNIALFIIENGLLKIAYHFPEFQNYFLNFLWGPESDTHR